MDPTLLTALLTLFTALVPILGTLLSLWINNKIKDEKQKKLYLDMLASIQTGVKATAQTITAGQRDGKGNLSETLKQAAKQQAIEQAKILMGSEALAAAKMKYGVEGDLDKVLSTMVEAALHDVKAVKATTMQSTSVASPGPDGSVVTTTRQAATSATETPPQNP